MSALLATACGSGGSTKTSDAGVDMSVGCVGSAPSCYGTNDKSCCADEPVGTAECVGGDWVCGSVVAPGCLRVPCHGGHGDLAAVDLDTP